MPGGGGGWSAASSGLKLNIASFASTSASTSQDSAALPQQISKKEARLRKAFEKKILEDANYRQARRQAAKEQQQQQDQDQQQQQQQPHQRRRMHSISAAHHLTPPNSSSTQQQQQQAKSHTSTSTPLRSDISLDDALKLIAKTQRVSAQFCGLTREQAALLVARGAVLALHPGEVLMKRGEQATFVAVCLAGTLEVHDADGTIVGRLHRGAMLGESTLFAGGTRAVDVVAAKTNDDDEDSSSSEDDSNNNNNNNNNTSSSSSSQTNKRTKVLILHHRALQDLSRRYSKFGAHLLRLLGHSMTSKFQTAVAALDGEQRAGANGTECMHIVVTTWAELNPKMSAAHDAAVAAGRLGLGKGADDEHISACTHAARLARYAPGEVVLKPGDGVDALLFVLSGVCEEYGDGDEDGNFEPVVRHEAGAFVNAVDFVNSDAPVVSRRRISAARGDPEDENSYLQLAVLTRESVEECYALVPRVAASMLASVAVDAVGRLLSEVTDALGKVPKAKAAAPKIKTPRGGANWRKAITPSAADNVAQKPPPPHPQQPTQQPTVTTTTSSSSIPQKDFDIEGARRRHRKQKAKRETEELRQRGVLDVSNFAHSNAVSTLQLDELLDSCQAFSRHWKGLTAEEARRLAAIGRLMQLPKGDFAMHRGDPASFTALVAKGCAELVVAGQAVAMASAGMFVGEALLFTGGVNTADVVASTDDTLLVCFPLDELESLCLEVPSLGLKLSRACARAATGKLRDALVRLRIEDHVSPKECHESRMFRLMHEAHNDGGSDGVGLGHGIEASHVVTLADYAEYAEVTVGKRIIGRGDAGCAVYFILDGTVELHAENDRASLPLGWRSAGDFVGEMDGFFEAFESPAPRGYSAFATTEVILAMLRFDKIVALTRDHPALGFRLQRRLGERISRQLTDGVSPLLTTRAADRNSAESGLANPAASLAVRHSLLLPSAATQTSRRRRARNPSGDDDGDGDVDDGEDEMEMLVAKRSKEQQGGGVKLAKDLISFLMQFTPRNREEGGGLRNENPAAMADVWRRLHVQPTFDDLADEANETMMENARRATGAGIGGGMERRRRRGSKYRAKEAELLDEWGDVAEAQVDEMAVERGNAVRARRRSSISLPRLEVAKRQEGEPPRAPPPPPTPDKAPPPPPSPLHEPEPEPVTPPPPPVVPSRVVQQVVPSTEPAASLPSLAAPPQGAAKVDFEAMKSLQDQMSRFQSEMLAMREQMIASEQAANAARRAAAEAEAEARMQRHRADAAETQVDFVSRLPSSKRENVLLRALALQFDNAGGGAAPARPGALPSLVPSAVAEGEARTAMAVAETRSRVESHGARNRDRAGAVRRMLHGEADREDRRRRIAEQRRSRAPNPLGVAPIGRAGGGPWRQRLY